MSHKWWGAFGASPLIDVFEIVGWMIAVRLLYDAVPVAELSDGEVLWHALLKWCRGLRVLYLPREAMPKLFAIIATF